jgi:hypothetical protein
LNRRLAGRARWSELARGKNSTNVSTSLSDRAGKAWLGATKTSLLMARRSYPQTAQAAICLLKRAPPPTDQDGGPQRFILLLTSNRKSQIGNGKLTGGFQRRQRIGLDPGANAELVGVRVNQVGREW